MVSVDALLIPGLGFHRGCGTVPLPLSAQGGDRDGDLSRRGGPDPAGLPGLAGCAASAHGLEVQRSPLPSHLPSVQTGRAQAGTLATQPGSVVCNMGGSAAATGRGCLSPPVLPPGVGLSTPTRRMRLLMLDPTGRHPWSTVPPLPGTPGRAVWPGWGERREPHAEARARVLVCRQKRQSQSKSHLFIASAVGKPRCRGAVDGATRRWGGCPGGCTQDGAREEERCPGIPSGRQDGEPGDGDIPISLSCAPGKPTPASATPSIQGRCCRGC